MKQNLKLSRVQMYEVIRRNKQQNAVMNYYHKNFTNCSNIELDNFIKNNKPASKKESIFVTLIKAIDKIINNKKNTNDKRSKFD